MKPLIPTKPFITPATKRCFAFTQAQAFQHNRTDIRDTNRYLERLTKEIPGSKLEDKLQWVERFKEIESRLT